MIAAFMLACVAALVADRCARAHDRWTRLHKEAR